VAVEEQEVAAFLVEARELRAGGAGGDDVRVRGCPTPGSLQFRFELRSDQSKYVRTRLFV